MEKVAQNRPGEPTKQMMWMCCAAMLLAVGVYLAFGGAGESLIRTVLIFAPFLLCAGVHFAVHRMMGKSFHDASGLNTRGIVRSARDTISAGSEAAEYR